MNFNITPSILLMVFCFISCMNKEEITALPNNPDSDTTSKAHHQTIKELIHNLEDSHNDQVIVVAHRGDWRNAPENSLQAIDNCIEMGVDMVEIDVRETADGVLILMHDQTIERTTTGTGKVKELTWDYLKTLKLKDGIGHETHHKIPTLEEALMVCKDKILVNLDKSYSIFDKCFEIIQKTGTEKQVIIKGDVTYTQVKKEFGKYLDKIYFMPLIRLKNPLSNSIVNQYLDSLNPIAFEFTVPQDTIKMIDQFDDIRAKGASIWVNSLWPQHNGGHDDEKAASNPEVYHWYIENDIDIIQTDRPQLLLTYLREKGLHK